MTRPPSFTRRASRLAPRLLLGGALLIAAHSEPLAARENNIAFHPPTHGLSIFGELKYPKDFAHFDYVRADAPKGGTFSHVGERALFNASFLTFDTLNGYILKGNAAQGLSLIFDSLMARALDEPDALYGLVAERARISLDGRHILFYLREEARFHNGEPLTAHDAAFSLHLLKEKGHPLISQNLREMEEASALSDHRLLIRLSENATRFLPLFIASLPIFSKRFYETHDFAEASLTEPLGSGPYKIAKWQAGQSISYGRVKDYWARDLPVNRGRHNFDMIRFEYFRDRVSQFEAFKSGAYLFREEFTSKVWATEYDFPAMRRGDVVRLTLPDKTPSGAQGWFLNMRREKFQDPRVREALGNLFDFEWTNKSLFHRLYERTESFFENSDYKASALPRGEERRLLEKWRGRIPPSAFGKPVSPPRSNGSGRDRRLFRRADKLLREAGWRVRDGKRVNEAGETLTLEFLTQAPTFERILAPYIRNLRAAGIDASMRLVDAAQYRQRLKGFDFDITTERFTLPNTPGITMRDIFSSTSADIEGSRNLSGIKNPAIDGLIEQAIAADSREELVIILRALDRVLRALRIWVPQWHKPSHHLAFWDIYGRPEAQPLYGRGARDTWWVDPKKARRLSRARGGDAP